MKNLIKRGEEIQRVTKKFGRDTAVAAGIIQEIMRDAGTSRLDYDGGALIAREIRSNIGSDEILTFEDTDGDLLNSVIHANGGYYLHGDINCWIDHKNRDEAIRFIQDLPEILKVIDKLATVPEIPNLNQGEEA